MDIKAHAEREVAELHHFFQQWFNGELPDTDQALERFAGVMANGFHIVSPDSSVRDRKAILAAVRRAHGAGRGEAGLITFEIRNHHHRHTLGDTALVTYEEWQKQSGEWRGRLSSAWLQAKGGTPNDLHWLHVHETWLRDDNTSP